MEVRSDLWEGDVEFLLGLRENCEKEGVFFIAPHSEACDAAWLEDAEGFSDHFVRLRRELQAEICDVAIEGICWVFEFFAVRHFDRETDLVV